MSIYLIDYENTKNLTGIDTLSSDDQVIIFYSKNANTITIDTHRSILESKAKIEYKLVEVGKQNALDLQLSAYMGYLIKLYENTDCKFYIVAKDKVYPFVATFWKKEKDIEIPILADLSGTPQDDNAENTKETTAKKTKATTTKKATTSTVRKTKSTTTKKAQATADKKQSSTENENKATETQAQNDESDNHSKITLDIEDALRQSELGLKEDDIKDIASCTIDPNYRNNTTSLNNKINKILKDSTKVPDVLKVLKPFIKK